MSEGSKGSERVARFRLWALALVLLAGAAGCIGPGLEPPWSDDEAGSNARASTNAGPGLEPPSMDEPAEPDSDFGNSMSGGAAGSTATGGAGMAPGAPAPMTPPASSAGSGAVEQPPTMTPTGPLDPSTLAGAGAASGLSGVDFVPECDAEQPSELQRVEACRYPLADALAADLAAIQVATLDAGEVTVLVRGDGALSCLFGSDYYVDASSVPAAIVLCSQQCGALSPSAQLVVIEGCPPAP